MTVQLLKRLGNQVSQWPGISVRPHRFGGQQFTLGRMEVGHVHDDGAVEVPFPHILRDQLLAEKLAEPHRWLPDSGWVTFWMRSENDINPALRLLRLSYLRYVLKAVPNPRERFTLESDQLGLSEALKSQLRHYVPLAKEVAA